MANFYLVPWRFVGDSFVPDIDAAGSIGRLDLRPDSTVVTGWALVRTEAPATRLPASAVDMGDHTFPVLPTKTRNTVRSNLGLASLTATRTPDIAGEVLTTHATEDGTRWRPVRPVRSQSGGQPVRRYEIHLGGLLWAREEPA